MCGVLYMHRASLECIGNIGFSRGNSGDYYMINLKIDYDQFKEFVLRLNRIWIVKNGDRLCNKEHPWNLDLGYFKVYSDEGAAYQNVNCYDICFENVVNKEELDFAKHISPEVIDKELIAVDAYDFHIENPSDIDKLYLMRVWYVHHIYKLYTEKQSR